jgi:hypothetical protein
LNLYVQTHPTAVQIRLDTGDLRYFYHGIPVGESRMREPERSLLLAFASKADVVAQQWHDLPAKDFYPSADSAPIIYVYTDWYRRAAAWTAVDPHVAQWAAEDVWAFVAQSSPEHDLGGLPKSIDLLGANVIHVNQDGTLSVDPDWRKDDGVLAYLQGKGYLIPSTQPS